MTHATWLVKENGGEVVIRIYVSEAPATLVIKGFCDCDQDTVSPASDPSNPLLSVAPTGTAFVDATSAHLSELRKTDFYDVELRASAFREDTESKLSHAVLQNGTIVPAIMNNKVGNRKPSGTFKSLPLGTASHTPPGADIFAAQFSIDAI